MSIDREKWDVVDEAAGLDYAVVSVVALIRCNETGEVRRVAEELPWFDCESAPSLSAWESGNFACDCNRAELFELAAGKSISRPPCSEGRFSVQLRNAKTGDVLYDELGNG